MKSAGTELECLKYIDKCIECLNTSLASTTSTKAIESIKLQKDHHARQRDLLQFHVDKFRRNDKQSSAEVQSDEKVPMAYKGQIYGSWNDLFENLKLTEDALGDLKSPNAAVTLKLLELNTQLHQIVSQLVNRVDETVIENDSLRCKLKDFEEQSKFKDATRQPTVAGDPAEVAENHEEFAPLDLPKFDVS